MKPRPIFYLYFHDTEFVPIHVAEVIAELCRRDIIVHLFAHDSVKSVINGSTDYAAVRLHTIATPRLRFLSEFIFMFFLFPNLLMQTVLQKPRCLYVRQSAVSLVAILVAKITLCRCVIEVNDIVTDKLQLSTVSLMKREWVSFYTRLSLTMASRLFPVTEQIKEWIHTTYKIDPGIIHTIPNGVNVNRFTPQPQVESRQRYGINQDSRVILSLGSLFPWAGIETLIDAADRIIAQNPQAIFVIGSGEEPYVSRCKKLTEQKQVQQYFHFFGFIPWDEASYFISTADICVAPFIFKNQRSGVCSLRVLSYLACGKPVVGSDIPGLGDILERAGVGYSFPMGNHSELAQAINKLLSQQQRLTDMTTRARQFVNDTFSWQIIIDTILSHI
ncbi:MAG: glycosyltransferase family 4 protein [Chitinivibrionales bacterium]|nr:glycosyltransferase family 4 protein [Chitinivibrionales bacterium]